MAQRIGRPTNEFSVVIIDEDRSHANSAKYMLSRFNFHVTVCSSPITALVFLEDHAEEVGFVLAAVHMREMDGFQFLEAARAEHQDLQVIMMSSETTMDTMMRCVNLGARFLVKKPLDENTASNLWQHLDLGVLKMEKINQLVQGVEDNNYHGGLEMIDYPVPGMIDDTEGSFIMSSPYLQEKFLRIMERLGQGASPREIEAIMKEIFEAQHSRAAAAQEVMDNTSYDDQVSDGSQELGDVISSNEAYVLNKSQSSNDNASSAESVQVAADEMVGHGNAKKDNADAAEEAMVKMNTEIPDEVSSSGDVQAVAEANKVKSGAGAGVVVPLVDYSDSDDDEILK